MERRLSHSVVVTITQDIIMNLFRCVVAMLACMFIATSGQVYAADEHAAQHGHGAAALSLDHGRQWPTDAPLRRGMDTLRSAFAPRLGAIHAGELSSAEYKALGELTEKTVGDIVAQCKLGPKADAMLHVIIADLMSGAHIMMGQAGGEPRAGAHTVVSALNSYGQYFDHPGWAGLE